MMEILLVIESFLVSTAKCVSDSHSLEFLSFGLKETGGQMQVRQLTVFDGVAVCYCDGLKEDRTQSDILQNWRRARGDILASYYQIHHLINMSVDVIQLQRGCVRSTNGTVSAFEKWAVSGIEFLTFEPDSLKWTARSPSANPVEQSWNKKVIRNHIFSHFLRIQCPSMMQNIKLKSTDQNTIDVRIFAKPIPNTAKVSLRCHVTSTDRSLKVYLTGDGAPMVNQVGPLPTGDGAVIFRLTAEIFINHNSAYVCTVQTRNNNISVLWDGHTLDGRRIRIQMVAQDQRNSLPNLLAMVFGFGTLVLITSGFWCFMNLLIKIVKVKRRHPPLFDKNLPLPEQHEEVHKDWMEMNMDTEEKQEGEEDVTEHLSRDGNQPKTMRLYG